MFEISLPAMLIALVGSTFMLVFAPRLLPVRETLSQQFGASERWFMTELFMPEGSHLAGKSLREARLANGIIKVLNLVRGDTEFADPAPDTRLEVGDRVVVHSRSDAMIALRSSDGVGLQAPPGNGAHDLETLRRRDLVMVEAIVGQTSRYILRPIRDLDLLARYGIHLVAVHRRNASFAQIGEDFELQGGDVLLVEGTPAQIQRFCDNGDLFALTEGRQMTSRRHKAPIALATIAGVMLLAALNVMPIEGLALIGAAIVIATGCLTSDEAYKSIEWPILVLIFGMLAISIAMRNSGLDQMLATELAALGEGMSPWLMLSLVILITSVATEALSNNAIAVLFTPVVIGLAQQMGVDPRPFVVGVMFADGSELACDTLVLALPPWSLNAVLERADLCEDLRRVLPRFKPSPIISAHVWLARDPLLAPMTGTLGTTVQWLFNKGRSRDASWRISCTISAAAALDGASPDELRGLVTKELLPLLSLKPTDILRIVPIRERRATFLPEPGLDSVRPGAATSVGGLFLAGDWTATSLPATIEGAVLSGELAAAAVRSRLKSGA